MTPLDRWHTWREILAQPSIWRSWAAQFDPEPARRWLATCAPEEIWCCGSGSSAYIGDILAAGLEGRGGLRAVPATDLIARPAAFLDTAHPLVVNFGRSGNSAETVGTLNALDALKPSAPRLNITCNPKSALATRTRPQDHLIVLPAATHDQGFAMTSSFSTLLLTALRVLSEDSSPARLMRAADTGEGLLAALPNLVDPAPVRVAFLGSGALTFVAREAALKVMELSAGTIACLWDSILGFRHGPKSFVQPGTLLVVFGGYDTQNLHYERDLIDELGRQFPAARLIHLGPSGDVPVAQPDGPLWAAAPMVLFAQVASALWANAAGLNVDDPFAGRGTLTRVVADVRLYGAAA